MNLKRICRGQIEATLTATEGGLVGPSAMNSSFVCGQLFPGSQSLEALVTLVVSGPSGPQLQHSAASWSWDDHFVYIRIIDRRRHRGRVIDQGRAQVLDTEILQIDHSLGAGQVGGEVESHQGFNCGSFHVCPRPSVVAGCVDACLNTVETKVVVMFLFLF